MSQATHPAINVQLRQALYDAVDDIGDALIDKRPVDLTIIRAIQSLHSLTRMVDSRLNTNALIAIAPAHFIEGEAS